MTGRLLATAGQHRPAADVYQRAITQDPLDEAAHRHLMVCLARLGEVGQAARLYEQLTERLRSDLGVSPAAETTAVYRQLSRAR